MRAGELQRIVDLVGDGLANICLAVAGMALIVIVAINGANVVARYLFGSPFSWAEELMLFLMILSVFAGAIAVTWRNLHIRIDTFLERMPPAARRTALAIGSLISIAVIGVITFHSGHIVSLLRTLDQRSDALQTPSWIPQSFVTIGLGTIVLIIAVKLAMSLLCPAAPTADAPTKDKP
jgi:TRAP-type C4-dicarboxylate transport system permease small subunit